MYTFWVRLADYAMYWDEFRGCCHISFSSPGFIKAFLSSLRFPPPPLPKWSGHAFVDRHLHNQFIAARLLRSSTVQLLWYHNAARSELHQTILVQYMYTLRVRLAHCTIYLDEFHGYCHVSFSSTGFIIAFWCVMYSFLLCSCHRYCCQNDLDMHW